MADPNDEMANFDLQGQGSAFDMSYFNNNQMFFPDPTNSFACHLPHDDTCVDANALHVMDNGKPQQSSSGFAHARSMSMAGPPLQTHLGGDFSMPPPSNNLFYNTGIAASMPYPFLPLPESPQSTPEVPALDNTESSTNDNDDCNSDRRSDCDGCIEGSEPCHDTDCNDKYDVICNDDECKDAATPCTDDSCLDHPDNSVQEAATVLTRLPDQMSGQHSYHGYLQDQTPYHDGLPGSMGQSMGFGSASAATGLLGNNYMDFDASVMNAWVGLGNHVSQYHASSQYGAGAGADCIDPSSCVYNSEFDNLEFSLARCPLPYQSHAHPGQSSFCTGQTQANSQLCQFEPTSKDEWLEHVKQQHPCVPQNHSLMHADVNLQPQPISKPTRNIRLNIPTSMSPAISSSPVSSAANPQSSPGTPLTPADSFHNQFGCKWVKNGLLCGMEFQNDDDLQKHCRDQHLQDIVKGATGFKCQWLGCSRAQDFSQKSKLERHLQTHTGFKPVKCDVCGVSLSAKQSLAQHKRIHTGEKPWVCQHPGCGSSFKQQSALTMHTRTHTGAKPLRCDICGKAFGESSNLSKHKKTHNIKGQYSCEICGKDFHRLDQQRRHMKTHMKENPSIESSPAVESPGTTAILPIRKLNQDRVTKRK